MFSKLEVMIAIRYLGSRRQEGFISVIAWFSLLGIVLGVATLIIVMSVMNGFRSELLKRIIGLNGHISVYHNSAPIKDFDNLAVRLGEVPGVLSVTPQLQGQVMALVEGRATGALVTGMRRSALEARQCEIMSIHVCSPNMFIRSRGAGSRETWCTPSRGRTFSRTPSRRFRQS